MLEAAATLGMLPGQIAKTLSLRVGNAVLLIVAAGDYRLDNRKVKDALGSRPRMLPAVEVEQLTGHPVGGVCPFGLPMPLPIYCDISLRQFDSVYPAAGSRTASVRITPRTARGTGRRDLGRPLFAAVIVLRRCRRMHVARAVARASALGRDIRPVGQLRLLSSAPAAPRDRRR